MVSSWVPWSAASLVSGAVLLVLGVLTLPLGADVAQMLAHLDDQGGRWLMGASALILSSIGLTLGMPSLVWLQGRRTTRSGLFGVWLWSTGAIGLCAMGTVVVALHTVTLVVSVDAAQAGAILGEPSLEYFAYTVLATFLGGELIVALTLARARVVHRWIPAGMVVHVVASPLVMTWPAALGGVHAVLLGAALMGIASRASEAWGSQSV